MCSDSFPNVLEKKKIILKSTPTSHQDNSQNMRRAGDQRKTRLLISDILFKDVISLREVTGHFINISSISKGFWDPNICVNAVIDFFCKLGQRRGLAWSFLAVAPTLPSLAQNNSPLWAVFHNGTDYTLHNFWTWQRSIVQYYQYTHAVFTVLPWHISGLEICTNYSILEALQSAHARCGHCSLEVHYNLIIYTSKEH